jgi:tetratricopeptide (TPR) repeat protein
MMGRWWFFGMVLGVLRLHAEPSVEAVKRRAVQMGDWRVTQREGGALAEGVKALMARVDADSSARGLSSEVERWWREEGGDSAFRVMVLARLAAARGEGGIFDRYDAESAGGRWADLLFARAWLKGATGDGASAEREGKAFLAQFAADERRGRAALLLARQLIARAAYPEARVALRQGLDGASDDLTRGEMLYAMGTVQFGQGEFGEAFESFRSAAARVDYPERAFFNAGLAAVRSDDANAYASVLHDLEGSLAGRERAEQLQAEQMLERARRGLVESSEIADFLASGGGGPLRADLQVVLALFRQREGRLTEDDITSVELGELSPAGRRLLLVLRLMRGEAGADAVDALASPDWASAGPLFLEQVGGAWAESGELLRAERAYVSAAADAVDEGGRQRSFLLAGLCAAASGEADGVRRAMGHWDAVGGAGGKLALVARLHQGVMQMHLGNHDVARAIFAFVIKAVDSAGAIRTVAESCITEVAFQVWERSRSESDAVGAVMRLRRESTSSTPWGRADCRARYRVGQILLEKGDVEGAVEEWKALLAGVPDGGASIHWVESAGFALATVLERRGDYRGGAESMARVAALGGTLATEAAQRGADLKLRGFLPLR